MDFLPFTKRFMALLAGFMIAACSDSGSEVDEQSGTDSRSTLSAFLLNKSELSKATVIAELTQNMQDSANQASISFSQQALENLDTNAVVVTWPMLSHLPLITAASFGDSLEEVTFGLSEFELEGNWARAIEAIRENSFDLTGLNTRIWWQKDSRFETNFLNTIDFALNPSHINKDFKHDNDILDEVSNAVTSFIDDDYNLFLQNYSNTQLVTLNQIQLSGEFDAESLTLSAFNGLFLSDDKLVRAPLIRFQGMMDSYQSSELKAYKIPLEDKHLSLVSIQPKADMREYVLDNFQSIFKLMNSSWLAQETEAILPVIDLEFKLETNNWFSWKDIDLIYSEVQADLRAMDHLGKLYMQSMPYLNRIRITEAGLELAGVTGHAVTYSELNLPNLPGQIGSVLTSVSTEPNISDCIDTAEDLLPGFIVVIDEASGVIQAILNFSHIDGTHEGTRC